MYKKIFYLVLLIIVFNVVPGYTQEPFTIKDDFFKAIDDQCTGECKFEIFMKDGEVSANSISECTVLMKLGEKPRRPNPLWCPGATQIWKGKVTIKGYIFDSDSNAPLQFVVDTSKGFYYKEGKGTITMPDGKVRKLPQ